VTHITTSDSILDRYNSAASLTL